jgi:hypothetical protein
MASSSSDRPVQLFNLKEPNGILSIPISPARMFAAVNDGAVLDKLRRVAPRELAFHANTYVVSRARRFVWAQDTSAAALHRGPDVDEAGTDAASAQHRLGAARATGIAARPYRSIGAYRGGAVASVVPGVDIDHRRYVALSGAGQLRPSPHRRACPDWPAADKTDARMRRGIRTREVIRQRHSSVCEAWRDFGHKIRT